MALKTLRYTVFADGVSPNYERRAGVQYDHKKYAVQFNLDIGFYDEILGILGSGIATYRIDCCDGEGVVHVGEVKELVGISLDIYELEYWVTRFGGKLKVNLVITITDSDTTTNEWIYEVKLNLENLPESDIDDKQYKSLSTLALLVEASEKKAEEDCESIANIYEALKELESFFKNGEWVFDGSAGSEIDILFAIDDELNSESNNAVSNKAVTVRLSEIAETLKTLTKSVGDSVRESIIGEIKDEVFDLTHPVGSYYWSDNSTDPTNLFGGVWQPIKDVFLLAAGDKYGCGDSGGTAEHALTENEMPKHSHLFKADAGGADGIDFVVPTKTGGTGTSSIKDWGSAHSPGHWASGTWGTDKRGKGQAHNNMPPYVVAYCWKRIG